MSRPANQSAGILDDYAIRKNVATREGTIEKVPVNDSDITNKKYVDGAIAMNFTEWSTANFTSGDGHTALTNSAQAIKATAGKLGGYYIYNPNDVAIYVHVYNVAHGSVTVGTTTAQCSFCIPPASAANVEFLAGITFSTAMSCAATTTGGGNTAPTTALEANIFYT